MALDSSAQSRSPEPRRGGAITPSAAVTSPLPTPPPPRPIPSRIGQYVVRRQIASGGMGDVFECVDERLGKAVAVKVSHTRLATDPEILEQIRDEARRLASVKDRRYVLRVLSAGDVVIDGVEVPYVAMEFEEDAEHLGGPCSNAWRVERKVEFFIKVCQAVQALHEQHLVHADIKPSNILVVGDEPRLIDFGIARVVRRLGGEPGQIVGGTPGYFDPALLTNPTLRPDQRSDIYCLGITLAEFLTGRAPQPPSKPGDACWPDPGRPPSVYAPEIDAELDAIVLRSVAHAPGDRYQSVEEFAGALKEWLAFRGSVPARMWKSVSGAGRTGVRMAARWPLMSTLLTAAAAAAVAFALSPLLFRWTSAARLTQPLAAHASGGITALSHVRVIELRDAARLAELAREHGIDIPVERLGGERLIWATLARKLAEANGVRVVGFDLMFRGDYEYDPQVRDAFLTLARASECGSVVVGLERWGDEPPMFLRANDPPGALRAACLRLHGSDAGSPPMAQLAVLEPDERYALPSFALLVAALAERPGWEPQVLVDRGKSRVETEFARTDRAGVRRRHDSSLILMNQTIDPLPPDDARDSAKGRSVAKFPIDAATDEAVAEVRKDASEVLMMPAEELRLWIGSRAVILCDMKRDPRFRAGERTIPGAYLQASAVESLLSGQFLKMPSAWMSMWGTFAAALAGAGLAAIAAALGRGRGVGWATVLCVLFGSLAVVAAGSGGLLLARELRYFVNPLVICLSALFAFAAVFFVHARTRTVSRANTH